MKKSTLVLVSLAILILGITNISKAQLIRSQDKFEKYYVAANSASNHYQIWTSGMWRMNNLLNIKRNKEKEIKIDRAINYKVKRNGTRLIEKYRSVKIYDKNGRVTDEQDFRRGKEKRHYQFVYNKEGYYTDFRWYMKGRYKKHETLSYNDNNDVLEYKSFKGLDLQRKWQAKYKDTLLESQWSYKITKKDSCEISRLWEYNYYKTNQKKETKYYKKENLKHTWSFSCDDEGKEITNKEKTQVCELKQYNNDGSYVLIKRYTGKKGKVSKDRLTYDKNDRLIMRESINKNDKVTNKQSYKWNDEGKQIAWYYYKQGKKSNQIRWGREKKLNSEGKVLEEIYIGKKGVAYGKYIHTYNTDQQIKSSEYIDLKKDNRVSRYEYAYNEKGLLVEKLRFNKKEILVRKYKSIFFYY